MGLFFHRALGRMRVKVLRVYMKESSEKLVETDPSLDALLTGALTAVMALLSSPFLAELKTSCWI